jgi:hypothetical protein
MTKVDKVSAEEAREKLSSPETNAMLVCAYKDRKKCEKLKIDGAIAVEELENKESAFPREMEIIFYCN